MDGGARIDGRRVKELRRALLLSQRELAQLAGVVTETVNRIERQPDRTFRPDTVRHLAKVLGVDPHELMVVEEPEGVDPHELMVEEPEDAAKNLAQLATVGREDGYTHFSRQEGIPTTGNEGEIIVSLTGLESGATARPGRIHRGREERADEAVAAPSVAPWPGTPRGDVAWCP